VRILLVAPSSTRVGCGVGDHTVRLGRELADRSCEVHIAADAPTVPRRVFHRGLTLHLPFREHGLGDMRRLVRLATEIKPDLVHIQYQVLTYAGSAAILALPRLLGRRARIAVTMHDFLLPYLGPGAGPIRHALLRDFLRRSKLIFLASARHRARAVQAGAREAAIRNIMMASNIEPCARSAAQEDALRARYEIGDRTLLTSFGAVTRSGAVELLLQALGRVPAAARNRVRCLIAGGPSAYSPQPEDDLQAVRSLALALGLDGCVQVTGFLENQEISALLQMSRAVIQPRQDAASPISTATATAIVHRKPLLAVGSRELLDSDMPAGAIHFSAPDPASLAGAIRRLAEGETLWAPAAQAELEACAYRFSWQHLADQHFRFYGECVGSDGGAK
jgi:glycosyltransferase involved in cell wall biosynthesis